MTVILHALLLDIPEELQTERLALRATSSCARRGIGTEATLALVEGDTSGELADSCVYARLF